MILVRSWRREDIGKTKNKGRSLSWENKSVKDLESAIYYGEKNENHKKSSVSKLEQSLDSKIENNGNLTHRSSDAHDENTNRSIRFRFTKIKK